MKINSDGCVICDQEGCEFPATHTFVWAQQGWTCQCLIHTRQMIALENHLGFNIAANTLRTMTMDEMMPDESEAG